MWRDLVSLGFPAFITSIVLARYFPAKKLNSKPEYSICFHGGAGVISRDLNGGVYLNALKSIINRTYAYVSTNKHREVFSAVDIVEYAVTLLEDEPLFNAGIGSVFTSEKTHELEASIMDGKTLQCGASSIIKSFKNPIQLARKIMENSDHNYIIGNSTEAVDPFESLIRVDQFYFSTEKRLEQLIEAKQQTSVFNDHDLLNDGDKGTVGCVAMFRGSVAAATSTGGLTNKAPGRIGDTPIIGCNI